MKPKYRDTNNPNRLTIVEFLQTLMDAYGDKGVREKYGMDAMDILQKITKDKNLSNKFQALYRKEAKEILKDAKKVIADRKVKEMEEHECEFHSACCDSPPAAGMYETGRCGRCGDHTSFDCGCGEPCGQCDSCSGVKDG